MSNDETNRPRKRRRIDFALTDRGVLTMKKEELIGFLNSTEVQLPNLTNLIETKNWSGSDFLRQWNSWSVTQLNEATALNQYLSSHTSQVKLIKEKKKFSVNTAISPNSDYFYVIRYSYRNMLQLIDKGGMYLAHGPRSSGKSTLLHEIIQNMDSESYVWGLIETPLTSIENLWAEIKTRIQKSKYTSDEVKEVLNKTFDTVNLLMNLFEQDYQGKKLVLFWDEFDTIYNSEAIKQECSGALREIRNQAESLKSYQAIVCFGTYNASKVNSLNSSPFVKDGVLSSDILDFTEEENKELFEMYMEEYGVTIQPEVIKDIHKMTGGHTGLTNACGRAIQNHQLRYPEDQVLNYDKWLIILPDIVDEMRDWAVGNQMIDSLKTDKTGETIKLLRKLCISNTGEKWEDTQTFRNLLNLGFAKRVKIEKDYLMIKSDMIKMFTIPLVFTEMPIMSKIPLSQENEVDIPTFLTTIVQHFDALCIEYSYARCSKKSGIKDPRFVPEEAVYQAQFFAICSWALKPTSWRIYNEVVSQGENKRLDFMMELILNGRTTRVGIEFAATVSSTELKEHATRDYPKHLKLDQYVVVHISPIQSDVFKIKSVKGKNKDGDECDIPIYHILHNEEFNSVKLHFQRNGKETVKIILPKKAE